VVQRSVSGVRNTRVLLLISVPTRTDAQSSFRELVLALRFHVIADIAALHSLPGSLFRIGKSLWYVSLESVRFGVVHSEQAKETRQR